mmetsp:Transcript_45555/g.74393  ORF Transcript_45555/g.74393 Transcript_45555/m.74393 type:complete len:206 (+) Transcript_45555:2526-3143(+)
MGSVFNAVVIIPHQPANKNGWQNKLGESPRTPLTTAPMRSDESIRLFDRGINDGSPGVVVTLRKRPIRKKQSAAVPPATGPDAAMSNSADLVGARLFRDVMPPKVPICTLGMKYGGLSLTLFLAAANRWASSCARALEAIPAPTGIATRAMLAIFRSRSSSRPPVFCESMRAWIWLASTSESPAPKAVRYVVKRAARINTADTTH